MTVTRTYTIDISEKELMEAYWIMNDQRQAAADEGVLNADFQKACNKLGVILGLQPIEDSPFDA